MKIKLSILVLGLVLVSGVDADVALKVRVGGNGSGSINVNSGQVNCDNTCDLTFPAGTSISLNASPRINNDAEARFTKWIATGSASACQGSAAQQCNFVLTNPTEVTAEFEKGTMGLSISSVGNGQGTVQTNQLNVIRCPSDCTHAFFPGASVTMNAVPFAGHAFVGWTSGTGSASSCSGTGPCSFTINQASSVQAIFNKVEFNLTMNIFGGGTGGNLGGSIEGPLVLCKQASCTGQILLNTSVTLVAKPVPTAKFKNWNGACSGTNPTCTFVMTSDKGVAAEFELIPSVSLSVTFLGNDDGGVSSSPGGITCGKGFTPSTCSASKPGNTTLTLTAIPAGTPKSTFMGWFQGTGSAAVCNGKTATTCQITLTQNSSIKAKFCRAVLGCLGN